MNVSQPISSVIEQVEFEILRREEIRAISVKRIQNDTTFDTLLNPIPGGLYDPALGSWGASPCATCHLNQAQCPGHAGHIELPCPVYHPMFMDQVLLLLRAQCRNCHFFRLSAQVVHEFICKLRLLQYGLVREAYMVEAVGDSVAKGSPLPEYDMDSDSEAEEEGSHFSNPIIQRRERFVRKLIQKHPYGVMEADNAKRESAAQLRREVVKSFLHRASAPTPAPCSHCQYLSPRYRKDGFVKIFEVTNRASYQKNLERNIKATDVMSTLAHRTKSKQAQATAHNDSDSSEDDEGVDMGDSYASSTTTSAAKTTKISAAETAEKAIPYAQRYIHSLEVYKRLEILFEKEQAAIALLYSSRPAFAKKSLQRKKPAPVHPSMFFIDTILVPPNRYRPEARAGGQVTEAQQNNLFKNILRSCERIQRAEATIRAVEVGSEPSRRDVTFLHQTWTELQASVNSLIDSTKNPSRNANRIEEGIKQKLEKKEGMFRSNMMGKRVNYAARSVISPDPNIETNEIGVPPVFATKLTYPEPVTSHNFRELQQAVINGADVWPGATAIENENGTLLNLRSKSMDERVALANSLLAPSPGATALAQAQLRKKKVHRHISNGDVVLMNRQPTLHKPSIMGHRVRVLPQEKTIRMHYANCNTYNADFDGDEMNMHFPQNEIARAEALQVADTDHQYISGTQGKPLRGLIQDHLSVSVALCSRDTYFDKGDYHQLLYSALRPESGHILGERIELVPPAIIKPVPRWTGKQIITTILKNIRPPHCGGLWMRGKTQLKAEQWGDSGKEEAVVRFHDGEFISGILDKAQLGPSGGGLIHAIHEIYGPTISSKFLSCLGRLLTRYLNMRAFSCGMDDLLLTPKGEEDRLKALSGAATVGLEVAAKYVSLENEKPSRDDPLLQQRLEEVVRDDSKLEVLDRLMSQAASNLSSGVTKTCLPAGLDKQFPANQMQLMTTSGAKGGLVNANQISCNLGQQTLEGRRVPIMVSGKSLPCFEPFETNVRAGGYIANRFLTGLRPQEYYFHHMAGREGLIDTAVKTASSGYLQRCIIKGMEGLTVSYDSTVRDSDGTLIQTLYGEDGLDVSKQHYLKNFEFILHNMTSEASQLSLDKIESFTDTSQTKRNEIFKHQKKAIKEARANDTEARDPISSLVNPTRSLFATSEKFYEAMTQYIDDNKDGLLKNKEKSKKSKGKEDPEEENKGDTQLSHHFQPVQISKRQAEMIFATKYLRSLVEPGEAVGIVAGQSIGEPSTQMTLNTFHLAGHSAKNVTLGIPRLREVLMTAAIKPKTPSMTLCLLPHVNSEMGEAFAKSISKLPLSYLVDKVRVRESITTSASGDDVKSYDFKINFFPAKEYTSMYSIRINDVMHAVESKLIGQVVSIANREIRKRLRDHGSTPQVGAKAGNVEMVTSTTTSGSGENSRDADGEVDEADDDDDEDEGDATSSKQRANRKEASTYGANDDEDDEIQRSMAKELDEMDDEDEDDFKDQDMEVDEGLGSDGSDDDGDRDTLSVKDYEKLADLRAKRLLKTHRQLSFFRSDERRGNTVEFRLEFSIDSPKLIMLNIAQEAIAKAVVQQIPSLGDCTFVADEQINGTPTPVVHTAGVNLIAARDLYATIDTNRILTNDIYSMLQLYGVEAARNTITQELNAVFGSHSISVDPRHINLIADYMTRSGGFTAFNRIGLKGNISPFTKMSFETTIGFLKEALAEGDWDDLRTPSSRIVMGKLSKVGTGSFDVMTRVPTMQNHDEMMTEW